MYRKKERRKEEKKESSYTKQMSYGYQNEDQLNRKGKSLMVYLKYSFNKIKGQI